MSATTAVIRNHTTVTVYSLGPNCPQCRQTTRRLENSGIQYTEVSIDQDEAARDFLTTKLDVKTAPIVIVDDGHELIHWAGFRPELLATLTDGETR